MRFKTTGEWFINLDDVKFTLGIRDKYQEFKIFNLSVIKPVFKELNEHSDLTLFCKTIRKKGK